MYPNTNSANAYQHMADICDGARLGCMVDILDSIYSGRESLTDKQMLALTAEDVTVMYNKIVGLVIGQAEVTVARLGVGETL